MAKKDFKKPSFASASGCLRRSTAADKKVTAGKEINLEDIPFAGGLLKGIEKLVDLVEKVEEAGGEIKKQGEIKGLGEKTKGIYGFSIKTGIGGRPQVQIFGNIRPVGKRVGKKPAKGWSASGGEMRVTEIREPIVDVFDEKDNV